MSSVNQELLEILVCPETRKSVALADGQTIESLNAKIRAGELKNRGGSAVEKELAEGLVREDGKVLYPIDDGIPVMLIEESIEL